MDVKKTIEEISKKAKEASRKVANLSTAVKDQCLLRTAELIEEKEK